MESCSQESLQQFLKENAIDLATLSLDEFRGWLDARIERASRHQLFQERCRACDLKRQYRSRLRYREQRLQRAEQAYGADPASQTLERLRENVRDLTNAVAELSRAVAESRANPVKLSDYEARRAIAVAQFEHLQNTTPTSKRREQARKSLAAFKQEIGLTEIEKTIERLGLERGQSSSRAGKDYEQTASQRGRDPIAEFLAKGHLFEGESIELLHKVTLGCARGEFDQLIVAAPHDQEPVRVLAVLEMKRNINDLVHGFRLRQENLAWLVGDRSGYAARLYRTKKFPDGHFTTAIHQEHGRRYVFNSESFQQFATPDATGYRLEGLWFITNRRPLLGVTSRELGKFCTRSQRMPA